MGRNLTRGLIMKVSERHYNPVTVNYFGIFMPVPPTVRYMATDKDGTLHGFNVNPMLDVPRGIWRGDGAVKLATLNLHGVNWLSTLRAL